MRIIRHIKSEKQFDDSSNLSGVIKSIHLTVGLSGVIAKFILQQHDDSLKVRTFLKINSINFIQDNNDVVITDQSSRIQTILDQLKNSNFISEQLFDEIRNVYPTGFTITGNQLLFPRNSLNQKSKIDELVYNSTKKDTFKPLFPA